MSITNNIEFFNDKLKPYSCKLIAVSKKKPVEDIMEAYNAGQRDFGENKVQELVEKAPQLPSDIRWHMIGHLQRNKVKFLMPSVTMIHSVDSVRLLTEIEKQAANAERRIPCLLQVHIAKEETKFGFSEDEVYELLASDILKNMKWVHISGLMGMATFTENTDLIRSEFHGLKSMFEKIKSGTNPEHNPGSVEMVTSSGQSIKIGSCVSRTITSKTQTSEIFMLSSTAMICTWVKPKL